MGRQLAEEGLIDSREDIFYLTIDEVWDFVKGTAVSADLRGLAASRKAEFAEYRENEEAYPDEHFETYGMAYHRNIFRRATKENAVSGDGDLRGIPCCPGVVSAPVKVIQSPSDDISLNGEILVAGRTDPGWVPLYPSVSGILIERGSILSHSAIVAREMGIPTIVGISGLLERLNTGDRVTMDGATGIVTVEGIF
jgi:pyruvate,water dikinase